MQNNLSNGDIIALVSSYMSYANLIIVMVALIVAAVTIVLTIYYNRDKKRLIEEATHNILNKIADDEQMRNDFINKILENKSFKQEFERMVDIHIGNKMGIADKNQEKSNIGGLK